jgi:branched-chain amino acid transport system ATP-binding protein
MTSADPILDIRNIEVVYNNTIQVLRGLSLSVPRGAIVALLGSNGAGKSTTLKAISRLLELEKGELNSGEILFDGQSVKGDKPHELVRRGLFHVMEGRRVFEDLTVEENLTAATYADDLIEAKKNVSSWSMNISRGYTNAARVLPAICPVGNNKCSRSGAP